MKNCKAERRGSLEKKTLCQMHHYTRGWEITHTQDCAVSLIMFLLYPNSVHKQSAHNLLHYPSVAMTVQKKADTGLFLCWTQTESIHSPAAEKLQKRTLWEKLSPFGPSGEQDRMLLKYFNKCKPTSLLHLCQSLWWRTGSGEHHRTAVASTTKHPNASCVQSWHALQCGEECNS